MKIKHNKKRNTAFVYEALVKEATVAILKNDSERKSKAIKIIKKQFNEHTEIGKELTLYNLIVNKKLLDLRDFNKTDRWLKLNKPDYIFIAAARVGGILENSSFPADFIYDNLSIATNLIHLSYKNNVKKILYLGSSCIYPKFAKQPINESSLLDGPLEPTNEWYAIAKIAGLKLCKAYALQYKCNFISAMPTNLYGLGDNFDVESGHVLPGLINKIHKLFYLTHVKHITNFSTTSK